MATPLVERVRNGWNAFKDKADNGMQYLGMGTSTGSRPTRIRRGSVSPDSIVVPIYNRIGIDVSAIDIKHVRVDDNGRYVEDLRSSLQECLTLEANIDQASVAFFRDAVMTLCEVGVIAIVPVESRGNPLVGDMFDPTSLRVGRVLQFYPRHVQVEVYNDRSGMFEELYLPKRAVAIVENPLYAVMNEPNSALQRLIHKLQLLDVVDDQTSSGKLDIIIQLPYVIKSEARKEQAMKRRGELEEQLKDSKFGIGYTDGAEKITQLNRPAENNLLKQVEYLTQMLYNQLGLTQEIIDGTADEAAMINYHGRTIEPFLKAITQAMTRTFISKTARTQGQRIAYYRDPFKLVPVSMIAEISDKFTRNEIASANDIRTAIGWIPSDDPKAEELRNSNLSRPKGEEEANVEVIDAELEEAEIEPATPKRPQRKELSK